MLPVKLLRVCLFLLGAGLLALLVIQNDPHAALAAMRGVGWRVVIIVVFPFVPVALLDTLGWRYAFRTDRVPFWTLVWVRLAGEAVNMVRRWESVTAREPEFAPSRGERKQVSSVATVLTR